MTASQIIFTVLGFVGVAMTTILAIYVAKLSDKKHITRASTIGFVAVITSGRLANSTSKEI